ncbi:hypothetical protein GCM10023259_081990 [Thermocatellispora tengchongensis]
MGELEVPGYEVLGVLGQGGFGIVYRARQLAVGREVALKVDNRVLVSERDRRRFMREVTSAGALSGHPHVAHVYDAGVLPDGRPYMVLELCPGGSLLDRMRAEGTLAPAEVIDIGVRIADALAAAHAAGVLHRDVKPANILINRYGNVVLSDFGLATMPTGGSSGDQVSVTREALTPAYAPPEALQLSEPTPQGDVYSLAATLYALMFGRPPRFPETGVVNVVVIMALHRLPIPDIPGVPPELTEVLRRAMDSDPARRTPSAAALRDALAALAPGRPHPAPDQQDHPAQDHPAQDHPAQDRPAPVHDAAAAVPSLTPAAPSSAPPPVSPFPVPPPAAGPRLAAYETSPKAVPGAPPPPPGLRAAPTYPGVRRADGARLPEPPQTSGSTKAFVAVTAVFLVLLLAGALMMAFEGRLPGGLFGQGDDPAVSDAGTLAAGAERSEAPSTGGFDGVATYTEGCPAAAVAGAGAACVKDPECWGGMLILTGKVTIRRIACEESHVWETYAIAPLPRDSITFYADELEKHPTVKKTCAARIMLASRKGAAKTVAASRWQSSVLPPSEEQFQQGVRTYRCVGSVLGREAPGSLFH